MTQYPSRLNIAAETLIRIEYRVLKQHGAITHHKPSLINSQLDTRNTMLTLDSDSCCEPSVEAGSADDICFFAFCSSSSSWRVQSRLTLCADVTHMLAEMLWRRSLMIYHRYHTVSSFTLSSLQPNSIRYLPRSCRLIHPVVWYQKL